MSAAEQPVFKPQSKVYVGIVGSRTWPDQAAVESFVDIVPVDYVIVSGGAVGVDQWAADRARARGMQVVEVLPVLGQGVPRATALRRRTRKVVAMSNFVVAFCHKKSPGTSYAIECALELGKALRVYDLP